MSYLSHQDHKLRRASSKTREMLQDIIILKEPHKGSNRGLTISAHRSTSVMKEPLQGSTRGHTTLVRRSISIMKESLQGSKRGHTTLVHRSTTLLVNRFITQSGALSLARLCNLNLSM